MLSLRVGCQSSWSEGDRQETGASGQRGIWIMQTGQNARGWLVSMCIFLSFGRRCMEFVSRSGESPHSQSQTPLFCPFHSTFTILIRLSSSKTTALTAPTVMIAECSCTPNQDGIPADKHHPAVADSVQLIKEAVYAACRAHGPDWCMARIPHRVEHNTHNTILSFIFLVFGRHRRMLCCAMIDGTVLG